MVSRLVNNNMLFVIPSWGDLLGYPTLGKYVNHFVSKIDTDLVLFLAGIECSIPIKIKLGDVSEKRWLHYLFGLGYYYSKFELKSGRYITDGRQLTGLILSDFVYDHLASLTNITLENDRDVIIGDRLIKVPIDLSYKSNTEKSFIQGVLMRNVFIPYKDIFLEVMETIQNKESYQLKNGHMILSTHWDFYNSILISTKMNENLKSNYLNPTAGLNNISLGVDQHLNDIFSASELKKIEQKISSLRDKFSTLVYDPMYLFSILDNASRVLISEPSLAFKERIIKTTKTMPKESIFFSAENRMNSYFYWPPQFKRNTREELKMSAVFKELETHPPVTPAIKPSERIASDISQLDTQKGPLGKNFEIRTMKHEPVEEKLLPYPPEGNIEQILLYLKDIVKGNYEMRLIGKAFELARNNLQRIILQSKFMWEMGKYANLYQRKDPHLGLSQREIEELLEKIDNWIEDTRKNREKYIQKK